MTDLAYDGFGPGHAESDCNNGRFGLIEAAPATVCVIDANGIIIKVNKAWLRFAVANGCPAEALIGIGANYLEACIAGASAGEPAAAEALDGIVSVMRGWRRDFFLDYSCHAPEQQRWFRMIVTPVPRHARFIISHEPILIPNLN